MVKDNTRWVAFITTGSMGTWISDHGDPEAVAKRAVRRFFSDYGSLIGPGKYDMKVGVYDGTGVDLVLEPRGVSNSETGEWLEPVHVFEMPHTHKARKSR